MRGIVACMLFVGLLWPWAIAGSAASPLPRKLAGGPSTPSWRVLVNGRAAPRLSNPTALAIDQRGTSIGKWMYLLDNNRVVKLTTGGRYIGSWGTQGSGPGRFEHPTGIAVGTNGDVFVADSGNNRIQTFGAQGRFLRQWGTKGIGPGQFDDPAAVAVGGSGNVFVADRINRRIEKFSPTGRLLSIWPAVVPASSNPTGFGPSGPYALAVDAAANVYAAVDTGRCSGGHCVMDYIVLETFSPSGRVIQTVVGGNPYGPFAYGGSLRRGAWWQIGALAVDAYRHLFLAEWNPADRSSVTELTSATRRIGQWELPSPSGTQGRPAEGLALDPRGNVFVSDTPADRVLELVFR